MKQLLQGVALVWVGAFTTSNAARASSLVDVDALVTHQVRQVMASGVTRVDTWQERLVRRGNQVWIERVLPAVGASGHERETVAEHAGHRHFNGDTSARWLTLAPDGKPVLMLVDREHKVVVNIPAAEFGTVGFDGRVDAAASIVPPSVVRSMKPGAGLAGGDQWHTDRSEGWSHRVLWSESRQLALRVESQREDGSVRRVVSVQLQPGTADKALPWVRLEGYTAKQFDDFMD